MPCYAKNPVLLYTSGCLRTVCIHCRIDVRLSPFPADGTEPCEEVLRNLPPTAVPPLRTLSSPAAGCDTQAV